MSLQYANFATSISNTTMRITKKQYIYSFFAAVAALAVTRCAFPDVARTNACEKTINVDTILNKQEANCGTDKKATRFFDDNGALVKNKILSVPRFCDAFPDSNNVQLAAAQEHGVAPVKNRLDAEKRRKELVYIGASQYYCIDKLKSSTPYLVPRAAILLNDIGQSFMDSLTTKNVPLHKFIITSVLRTREDVDKLRGTNKNATVNSCHLYGTTFDICYNRYTRVNDPDGKQARSTSNDTLKWILSEVLRDMRTSGRCYIKYEVKQGCFHITVR